MKQGIVARALALLAALAVSQAAIAQGPAAVRKQTEASLRVTGAVHIATDGSVEKLVLDTPEQLPKGIADFVDRNVMTWQFEPTQVDGVARRAVTQMSALLVGKSIGDGQMSVSIRGADFSDGKAVPPEEQVTGKVMTPPRYPVGPAQSGAQGTAYLFVRVERDGSVGDVATEQVNLRIIGSEAQMAQYRERFADAAMQAARKWRFATPVSGEQATQPYWIVRVPVDFRFQQAPGYGKWEVYIPGPRTRPVWVTDEDRPGFSPEALADGGVHLAGGQGSGPKLLTPLEGA
jgi:hypothetical protein